ncbi:MAG: protein-glutamate O-methyltransferase CheR [Rhodospirillales bacterium]|nr:protein-glutamate O-methyltransferase CheR [Rhodospirillales bacterium]
MNVNDFELVAKLLKERSGLVLNEQKAYLLESRLNPVARRHAFKGFDELAQAIRLGKDEKLLADVTEAMTTNESFFFRDSKPFDQFRDMVLPHLLEHRAQAKSFRIWSAACSNGQEPYSLAMILKENEAKLAGWKVDIVATDLSKEVLDKAAGGRYSQFEVQRGLPINLMVKYFKQDEDLWRIDDGIRKMVAFKTFNLLDDPSPLGRFDVVFCRNVLIYFDQQTKGQVLGRIAKRLPPDGFLYLGGAETVLGISDDFQLIPGQRGVYGLKQPGVDPLAKAVG